MTDFNLFENISNKPIINTDEEYIAQQIEMLFTTDVESVLGDLDYGSNYDRFVYTSGISNDALQTKIIADLNSLDLRGFKPIVNVTFVEGTQRDIALIEVSLTDGSGYVAFNKTFMIK